jgi:hypothetical protein
MSRRFTGFILPFPARLCGEELFRDVLLTFTLLNLPSPTLNCGRQHCPL